MNANLEPALAILESHWRHSCAALSVPPSDDVFEALIARYREPHRAYHTLQHIGECIGHAAAVRDAPPELGLAIWFHDAIYDPRAKDNEKRSADWAEAVVTGTPAAPKLKRMILATRHDAVPADREAKLLVDVDLAILAAPEPRYSEYGDQVRREYAWLDDEAYAACRRKLLQGLADRPFLFGTPEFQGRLEARARRNLERSINALIQRRR